MKQTSEEKMREDLKFTFKVLLALFLFVVWFVLFGGIIILAVEFHWGFIFLEIIPIFILIYNLTKFSGINEPI